MGMTVGISWTRALDRDGKAVEVDILYSPEGAANLAARAAFNANGKAVDGPMIAVVRPKFRKQVRDAYKRSRAAKGA